MIQTVCESCSVRWTKVNRKVYKFQSLVFKDDSYTESTEALRTSESQCQGHSKITAPTQWKQIYGEYLGEEHELPNTTHNTTPPDTCIVRDIKKEQKRVHFEDDANDNKEQEKKQSNNQGCLPDCYLCRNARKPSPPYQVLPEQMASTPDL